MSHPARSAAGRVGAVKVPAITAVFWLVKVLTTGMGEAASDWLGSVSLLLAGAVGVLGIVVALVLQSLWPVIGFAVALALGAVVAPPDAVAATALGKRLGLPPRVVTILEGEGLLNDATALVLLSTAVAAIERPGSSDVEGGMLVGDFALAVVVALVIGVVVGYATVRIRQFAGDRAIDTAISLATRIPLRTLPLVQAASARP